MKADKASKTAINAAGGRAIHKARHGEPKILDDPYAVLFMDPVWRRRMENRVVYWLINRRFLFGWTHPIWGQVVVRGRFAEDCLQQAMANGATQYVLLGAGYDSFALRRRELADTLKIIEIDHPATQKWKRECFSDSGVQQPENVEYVSVDFERQSLADALHQSSFSKDEISFFSWMGCIVYIERSAVLQTFRDIALCAAEGSEIVFDHSDVLPHEVESLPRDLRRLMKNTKRDGEPMITGFPPAELAAELESIGFNVVESLSPNDQKERYFSGRTDGLSPLEHCHLVRARISPHEL